MIRNHQMHGCLHNGNPAMFSRWPCRGGDSTLPECTGPYGFICTQSVAIVFLEIKLTHKSKMFIRRIVRDVKFRMQ